MLNYWINDSRPVKVIRLLARNTVEEIMYSRAVSKLHLTTIVIEDGRFSLLDHEKSAAAGMQVSELAQKHKLMSIFYTQSFMLSRF